MSRREFDAIAEAVQSRGEVLRKLVNDVDIQFKRIAQIQADLDDIKTWGKGSR